MLIIDKKRLSINFTPHAERKLSRLTAVGVTKQRVIATIRNPTKVVPGHWGRKIAQGPLSRDLVLRVVYEEAGREIWVITLYPSQRGRYDP